MALWTPYADSVALDLSKTKIREQFGCYPGQVSPVSSSGSYEGYWPTAVTPPASPPERSRPCPEDDSLSDDPDFREYESNALRAMAEKNGGSLVGHNPRMRRAVQTSQTADDSYRRQRERNNFAAKQSRDRRKLREIHLALKVAYLRKQVAGLSALLASRPCARCLQTCRR